MEAAGQIASDDTPFLSTAQTNSAAQAAQLNKFTAASGARPSSLGGASSVNAANDGSLLGGQYRLEVGSAGPRVSSGKSAVVDAVRVVSSRGGGDARVKVKLSRNLEALKREAENLRRLSKCRSVITLLDFLENYDQRGGHALVMEAGQEDLVGVVRRTGALGRGEIKR